MNAMSLAPISRSVIRSLTRPILCAAALLALAVFVTPALADSTRITVVTGVQANQPELAGIRSDQTIRIVIADRVQLGIRRPPVAEPVLYVIEGDDAVRAVR